MRIEDIIRAKLEQRFAPGILEIVNESHLHAGHSGANETGETHFRITIASAAFERISRVARHRLVFTELEDLLAGPVHALSLSALAPGEQKRDPE